MSRYSNEIANMCEGRKTSYDVTAELKVRKVLEKHTGWNVEFTRNDDKYGFDINCFHYTISQSWERDSAGFVEVEESSMWKDGIYPQRWRFYSYLKRKVFVFDFKNGLFVQSPVENSEKTIYLKVARDLSDCHASLISDIFNHHEFKWTDSRPGLGEDLYNREMLRFSLQSKYVCRGWAQCVGLIKETFKV